MHVEETNVDRLLKARAEIDQALRQHKTAVSILFTDVVGSTSYFERYGDTAGVAMLYRHGELGAGVRKDSQRLTSSSASQSTGSFN